MKFQFYWSLMGRFVQVSKMKQVFQEVKMDFLKN